jgi:hypothetical protein
MLQRVFSLVMVLAMPTLAGATPAWASVSKEIYDALKARFAISRIEVGNAPLQGQVGRIGAVVTLQADGIPANRFRVIQANTKSPRFHVRDYARVEVAEDGSLKFGPGEFALTRGTRLVVLDLSIERTRVRIFTHTLERILLADDRVAYGCTEFVFTFESGALERGEVASVREGIERWLTLTPRR